MFDCLSSANVFCSVQSQPPHQVLPIHVRELISPFSSSLDLPPTSPQVPSPSDASRLPSASICAQSPLSLSSPARASSAFGHHPSSTAAALSSSWPFSVPLHQCRQRISGHHNSKHPRVADFSQQHPARQHFPRLSSQQDCQPPCQQDRGCESRLTRVCENIAQKYIDWSRWNVVQADCKIAKTGGWHEAVRPLSRSFWADPVHRLSRLRQHYSVLRQEMRTRLLR
jgi:hypothetical protein